MLVSQPSSFPMAAIIVTVTVTVVVVVGLRVESRIGRRVRSLSLCLGLVCCSGCMHYDWVHAIIVITAVIVIIITHGVVVCVGLG